MTNRRSRFERATSPTPLLLVERDLQLIRYLWEFRWLRRVDLEHLIDLPSVSVTNLRLSRLYAHQYLDRIHAGTVQCGLTPIYVVGEASVPLIAERTGRSPGVIRRRIRQDAQASPVLLPHDLLGNQIRIALTRALHATPGVELECWLDAATSQDTLAGKTVRPDGHFRIIWQGHRYAYFLEVDCGTTDLTRWQSKCLRYLAYRDVGALTERFGLKQLRVLTTAPTPERLQALRQATFRVVEGHFWFALTSDVLADASPLRPVWHPLGDVPPRALLVQ